MMASGENVAIVLLLSPPDSLFELVPSTKPFGRDILTEPVDFAFCCFLIAMHSGAKTLA